MSRVATARKRLEQLRQALVPLQDEPGPRSSVRECHNYRSDRDHGAVRWTRGLGDGSERGRRRGEAGWHYKAMDSRGIDDILDNLARQLRIRPLMSLRDYSPDSLAKHSEASMRCRL
jgi:hypothetical protein